LLSNFVLDDQRESGGAGIETHSGAKDLMCMSTQKYHQEKSRSSITC